MKRRMKTMTTKSSVTRAALMLLAVAVAGCDFSPRADYSRERANADYRAAMDEYSAGRLQSALKGLKKVCAADPTNASARFQLACLLQDSEKDYLSAYCAFREYVAQQPESDKARLAKDRLADCERELAKVLATRHGLDKTDERNEEMAAIRATLKTVETAKAKVEKDLADLKIRHTALTEENARLKNLMRAEAEADDDVSTPAADLAEAKAALQDEAAEAEAPADDLSEAKELLDEPVPEAPVLQQPVGLKEALKAKAAEEKKPTASESVPPAEARPATYVVQHGETLSAIALRFYGNKHAWRQIQNANKAIVPPNGDVKVGQRLVLP